MFSLHGNNAAPDGFPASSSSHAEADSSVILVSSKYLLLVFISVEFFL